MKEKKNKELWLKKKKMKYGVSYRGLWAMFNASESFKGLKSGGSITMAECEFNL